MPAPATKYLIHVDAETYRAFGEFIEGRTAPIVPCKCHADADLFALSREVSKIGVDECYRILDWFKSQGLSESLWEPQDDLDRAADAGRRYGKPKGFKLEPPNGKRPVRTGSATPDTFGVTGKLPLRSVAEAVEPAVFPYWITC